MAGISCGAAQVMTGPNYSSQEQEEEIALRFVWPLNQAFPGDSPFPTQKTATVGQLRDGVPVSKYVLLSREDKDDHRRQMTVTFSTEVRAALAPEASDAVDPPAFDQYVYTGHFNRGGGGGTATTIAKRHLSLVAQKAVFEGEACSLLKFTLNGETALRASWCTELDLTMPWRKTGSSMPLNTLGVKTHVKIQAILGPRTPAPWTIYSFRGSFPPTSLIIEDDGNDGNVLENTGVPASTRQNAMEDNPSLKNDALARPLTRQALQSETTLAAVGPSQSPHGLERPVQPQGPHCLPQTSVPTELDLLTPPIGNILWTICPSPGHALPSQNFSSDNPQQSPPSPVNHEAVLTLCRRSTSPDLERPGAFLCQSVPTETGTTADTTVKEQSASAVRIGPPGDHVGPTPSSYFGQVGGEADTIHVALHAKSKTVGEGPTSAAEC